MNGLSADYADGRRLRLAPTLLRGSVYRAIRLLITMCWQLIPSAFPRGSVGTRVNLYFRVFRGKTVKVEGENP